MEVRYLSGLSYRVLFCVTLWAVLLDSPSSYVVRACEYNGDPVELHDSGNVPALWEHRLLLRPLPNTTGTRQHEHTHIYILLWSYCCHCYRSDSKLPSCKKLHKTNLYTFLKKHLIVMMVILHVDVQLRWHCWSMCEISLRLVVGLEWISMNLVTLCLFPLPEHRDVNITIVTMLLSAFYFKVPSHCSQLQLNGGVFG